MLIDLHVHSDISNCSRLSIEDILANGRALGLDGVCVTDHDSMEILSQIKEGFQPDGLLVLAGMEYTTPQGDFLVFGPVEPLAGGGRMDADRLMFEVRRLGGAVVAAHPFREWRPSDASFISPPLCTAVETLNGRNQDEENRQAAELALSRGLTAVAGSDAHCLEEFARFPTRFHAPVANRAGLVAALKAGLCEPAAHLAPLRRAG